MGNATDISVTGITLSENQHAYATQKAKQDQLQQASGL
jgi:cyclopropane fatty-acyl-phospholipid synthase-like methyltransferase